MYKKIVVENINEFKKGLDPIDSLGLGRRALIEEWLKEMNITDYHINKDYTIDANYIYLNEKKLQQFPSFIQFGEIFGDFTCAENLLTSLRGCPKYVGGDFACYYNNLTTLEYSPKVIKGGLYCYHNKLTTLKYFPEYVGLFITVSNNELRSLRGCPAIIKGSFWCYSNKLTSLNDGPKIVNGVYWCGDNPGNFTKQDVLDVCVVKGKINTTDI